jgi:clan AA aspartic protease
VIQGTVVGMQARVNVTLRLPGKPDFQIECVVDTGFEGALTLPEKVVQALQLSHLGNLNANLANNASVATDVYVAILVWEGAELPVAVLALGERPLLGTALLKGHRLTIDFEDGEQVVIESIP